MASTTIPGLAIRVSVTSVEVGEMEEQLEIELVKQIEVRVEMMLVLLSPELEMDIEIQFQIPPVAILFQLPILMESQVLFLNSIEMRLEMIVVFSRRLCAGVHL